MKIWIDLTNSPHINFFKPFIKKWRSEGNEIIITTRDLSNTIALIKQNGWEYIEIGGHAGRNKIKKILYFPRRIIKLFKFLKKTKPEIGVSHSSFYSPLAGKLANVPTIYINDNEHAKGNLIAFKYANLNILPECLKNTVKNSGWEKKYNFRYYPGIKEGIYLSQLSIPVGGNVKDKIFIRLEPWNAEYYKGNNNNLDDLIYELENKYSIIILPRNADQIRHYENDRFKNVKIAVTPLSLEEICCEAILFIGAGGSMTREMAYLGVPTISIYQDNLLEVDRYLIKKDFLLHSKKPSIDQINQFIQSFSIIKDNELKEMGNLSFNLINKYIAQYAKN